MAGPEAFLFGLIGRGIGASRTPAMHMEEAARQGLACIYRILDMDAPLRADLSLPQMLDAAEAAGFDGLNITFPYKIEVIPLLHDLSDTARAIGAVNTVVMRNGMRIGHNTDVSGFAESFSQGLPGAVRDHVLLLGAGGAGVAVAHGLADCGVARLTLFDTDRARADALAAKLSHTRPACDTAVTDSLAGLLASVRPDGVVNATPVGMAKLPGMPLPIELLHAQIWVADIVYFPLETALLAAARAKGCRVLPGTGMAVHQAARAFSLFTGRAADAEAMRATFEDFDRPVQEVVP